MVVGNVPQIPDLEWVVVTATGEKVGEMLVPTDDIDITVVSLEDVDGGLVLLVHPQVSHPDAPVHWTAGQSELIHWAELHILHTAAVITVRCLLSAYVLQVLSALIYIYLVIHTSWG